MQINVTRWFNIPETILFLSFRPPLINTAYFPAIRNLGETDILSFPTTKRFNNGKRPFKSGLPGPKKLKTPNLAISSFKKGQILKKEKKAKQISLKKFVNKTKLK